MIIKATRLQAWALAGGARVGRCPPPPLENKIKILGLYWLFATFSSYGGLFATFFSFWGPFHHVWGHFRYFLVHGGGLFWACPPPYEKFCGRPRLQGGFESMLPGNFLCDCNLVSSGHVLLRFCLKNDKNNDKL